MKSLAMLLGLAIAAVAGIAASQEASAAAQTAAAEPGKPLTATGEIVRYDAGKTIVLRQADDRVVTYALAPTLIVPIEVQVGRRVSLVAEPAGDGFLRVTQITTLAATERTDVAPAGAESKTQVTTVYGTITGYVPGSTITVLQANRKTATYSIDRNSTVPSGLEKGRRVIVRTVTRPGLDRPLVRKVTYSRTKKTGSGLN